MRRTSISALILPRRIIAVASIVLPMLVHAQTIPNLMYSELTWRFVGPFRGGWSTMAEGIPDEPNTFFFGAVGGGLWKTTDAGWTWTGLMQHEQSSSVGAIAIAPSNPRIIYVGTGQVSYRYDILAGDGLYRSEDGGETWKHAGLSETRHIGRILVDPANPQRVLVAALGHVFGPNPERGVFLSTDGGGHWQRVLFVDDLTGAVDLASDPLHPSTVFAAMWQVRMRPWFDYFEEKKAPGSGIFKSTDAGAHWTRLKGNGLPSGVLARIGLAVSRGSGGRVVYATVMSGNDSSGLYKSDDSGQTWKYVNHDQSLASAYFGRLTADPKNSMSVYVMGRSIKRSTDGGENFTVIKGAPGGDDYHFLWINPVHPNYMITASDQGTAVSVNGGGTWSNWYNQPTGQFYHIAADERFPYRIYGSQQDNGTVQILSRGPYGVIDERDWHPVGADERDFVLPKPGNPDMVFGSGLGGTLSRFDESTRQSAQVSPWPISTYAQRPGEVKYRYSWITPIAFSPLKPYSLYFGAQVLFRSTTDGDTWDIISPDLSGKNPGATNCGKPTPEEAIACGYGVINEIAPSPVDERIIWIGTDDGLVQVTTDGGGTWRNVTPPDLPLWGRVDAIAASHFSSQKAYVAVNTQRLDLYNPLIFKTEDRGAHWKRITDGLPGDEYVNVVCEDDTREGLLFAGTSRGVYVSFNDGTDWQSIALQLPTTSVRDLLVHQNDLIAATQGRGIWVLDNISPLRELSAELASHQLHLFHPSPAWRLRGNENKDTPWPPVTPTADNPPTGAVIDYWLREDARGPVTLSFLDGEGRILRKFSSADSSERVPADRYFDERWLGVESNPGANRGMHRFVWDLRGPRPSALEYSYSIAGVWREGTPLEPRGSLVQPGDYNVVLSADGNEVRMPLSVLADPRIAAGKEDLRAQWEFTAKVIASLEEGVKLYRSGQRILGEKEILAQGVRDSISSLISGNGENLKSVCTALANLVTAAQSADAAPTQGQRDAFAYYRAALEMLGARWQKIEPSLRDGKE